MKKIVLFLIVCFSMITYNYGQINLKDKLKNKTIQRANKRTDQGINKGLDKTEEGIKDIFSDDKEKSPEEKGDDSASKDATEASSEDNTTKNTVAADTGPALSWSKYDFVPGNEIIFEDNQEGEENGEFPSRWDLVEGRVENAEFDNQRVIYFMTGSSKIIPYINNREQDYLPEEFTLEFNGWFEKKEYTSFYIWFRDVKNQKKYSDGLYGSILRITPGAAYNDRNKGLYPGMDSEWDQEKSFWRHISVSFNRRALKVYLDDARVLNVPNMEINPSGITIGIDGFGTAGVKGINRFMTNVRLAKGAVKLYDKLLQDGKIVSNGIRFDVGKATIKPESMGVLNKIHDLMIEHPDVKFSIEGHTDSDGSDDFNLKLSEQRAEAVVNKLVAMGISKDRFASKGFGETVPLASNDTPEGKASNRRVEFVKL